MDSTEADDLRTHNAQLQQTVIDNENERRHMQIDLERLITDERQNTYNAAQEQFDKEKQNANMFFEQEKARFQHIESELQQKSRQSSNKPSKYWMPTHKNTNELQESLTTNSKQQNSKHTTHNKHIIINNSTHSWRHHNDRFAQNWKNTKPPLPTKISVCEKR